jgi:hypothetical protein
LCTQALRSTWEQTCGALRGSVLGLVLFEGWGESLEDAERLSASDAIRLESNHHRSLAGTTSPSVRAWVVENATF